MYKAHNPRDPLRGHRIRHDGWNTVRVDRFLAHLAISGRLYSLQTQMNKT